MDITNLIVSVILIILGVDYAVMGYRINMKVIRFVYFVIGFIIGVVLVSIFKKDLPFYIYLIGGFVVGSIVASFSKGLLGIYNFMTGFIEGFIIGGLGYIVINVVKLAGEDAFNGTAQLFENGFTKMLIAGAICGIVLGALSCFFYRPVTIVATAFAGANVAATGILSIFALEKYTTMITLGITVIGILMQFAFPYSEKSEPGAGSY